MQSRTSTRFRLPRENTGLYPWRISEGLDAIHEDHGKSRPEATMASYKSPQKKYRDWCLQREVEVNKKVPLAQLDEVKRSLEELKRTLVTGSRVAVFLAVREKKVARAELPAEEITGWKTVGRKTMERYLCALCDLRKPQASTMNTTLVSPRVHPQVQPLGQTLKRKSVNLKKSHHNDRAQGTFLDGYSLEQQFAKILTERLDRTSSQRFRNPTTAALTHFGLLRGENTRGIQLSDLQFL